MDEESLTDSGCRSE